MLQLTSQPLELLGAEDVFGFPRRSVGRLSPKAAIEHYELNVPNFERSVNVRRLCCESEGLEELRFGSVAILVPKVPRIICTAEKIVVVPYRRDLALVGAHMREQGAEMRIAQ